MSTVQIGVVGLGFFSLNHLETWRVIDGAEIAAVCDRDPAKVEAARARFGVGRGFTDLIRHARRRSARRRRRRHDGA